MWPCTIQLSFVMTAKTQQIFTRLDGATKTRLVTELVERPLRKLRDGEILVEMLLVPMHGSFWLASHPALLHPRREILLRDGGFVFGNGGVGRVVKLLDQSVEARVGDYIAIYGHVPCARENCQACRVHHRYAECEFKESTILGHGGGSADGTYSRYVILPCYSYEICYRADEAPDEEALRPLMYAFLFADVRNALTRDPESMRRRRLLLFGAGQSGRIAAYLFLQKNPDAKVVVVDSSLDRAAHLKSINSDAIEICVPPSSLVVRLNEFDTEVAVGKEFEQAVVAIVDTMRRHFDGQLCDLVFDASSGNSAPLWTNAGVLSAGCHCIVFGFGSDHVTLDRHVLQISGLRFLTSRGVGTIENRREVIRLIKGDGSRFIDRFLRADATRLSGFEEAIGFVKEQHRAPKMLHEIPPAYVVASPV